MLLEHLDDASGLCCDLTPRAVAGKDCQTIPAHGRGTCFSFINPTHTTPFLIEAILDRRSMRTGEAWTVRRTMEVEAHE